jgi:ribosome maturation factor RimP
MEWRSLLAERIRPNLKKMASQVLELLEPELAADGFEILDVRVFQGGGRLQVRIYVDLEQGGISLGQCAKAGRSVNMLMEEADIFLGQYVLEVSSPGIRRPLRLPRHFEDATGQKVDLKVRAGNKSRRVRGDLLSSDGQNLLVQLPIPSGSDAEEGKIEKVAFKDVMEANLDPDFDVQALINENRREKKEDRRQQRRAKKKPKKGRPKNLTGKKDAITKNGDSSTED